MTRRMREPMRRERAAEIKRRLRAAAEELRIDLNLPENRCTFWTVNGSQGYLCWSRTNDLAQLDLRNLLGQFWPDSPTILEINDTGDRVTLFTAETG